MYWQQIFEMVNDHNGRVVKSHLLKHAFKNDHQYVSDKRFQNN